MQKVIILLAVLICAASGILAQSMETTEGTLVSYSNNGKMIGICPLRQTSVIAEISGFIARVTVTQEFENTFNLPIEAVYKFPLSENSAVDDMTMKIGARVIRAKIMTRADASAAYELAKSEGKTASLLEQERPNIFTQQIANILPNDKIIIEISYVETLKYEDGEYEFSFPLTVGERYTPGSMTRKSAAKVISNIAKTRTGHVVSIEISINAGVPIEGIRSSSHQIQTQNLSANSANVALQNRNVIPNKDFVLRFDVTGKRIEDAVLTHHDERGGFFTLILSPPEKFSNVDITPKEIVFLLDVSGSMGGFPIEKAKEAMRLSLEGLNPHDTFNLITFASGTQILFENPVPPTVANIDKAKRFLQTLSGGGATEMMPAIKAALAPSDSQRHVRIVCFMTDGYVGNDMEIIGEVQKHPNARVFAFGIGSSTNRFLLDKISEAGRGEVEYVSLDDDGEKAAKRFYERVRTPLLTDLSIDWGGLPVTDIYPRQNPDLFSAKPVIIHGRYNGPANGTIMLKGNVAGQQLVREIHVDLPESQKENDALALLWARTKIDDLMSEDWSGIQNGSADSEITDQITKLGLDFHLMTQFTSFVAVEEIARNHGGKSVKVEIPTENPDGVQNIERIDESPAIPVPTSGMKTMVSNSDFFVSSQPSRRSTGSNGSGIATKTISGGVVNGKALKLPSPTLPAGANARNVQGSVSVQVLIDENGNVISSAAVSGHPLLRAAAENAARQSQFAPTVLSGKPIKVSGIIIYNFVNGQSTLVTDSTENPSEAKPPLTDEMKKLQRMHEKFYPQIVAAIEQLNSLKPDFAKLKFVKNGSAKVEVWLTESSPEILEKLRQLGFEMTGDQKKLVLTGTISVSKLTELAEIGSVQYVLPKID